MKIILLAAAALGFSLAPAPLSAPVPSALPDEEDCALTGPHENNNPNGPVIDDDGSGGTTKEEGCDGCKITTHEFTVTWPHDGQGNLVGFGTSQTFNVEEGETTNHTFGEQKDTDIACEDERCWIAWMTGEIGNASQMCWNCLACE